jgi:hypothetical protein
MNPRHAALTALLLAAGLSLTGCGDDYNHDSIFKLAERRHVPPTPANTVAPPKNNPAAMSAGVDASLRAAGELPPAAHEEVTVERSPDGAGIEPQQRQRGADKPAGNTSTQSALPAPGKRTR